MKSLVKSLITPFLSEADIPESNKVVGVFGGGFQPPTKGHFEVVRKALEMYPQLTEFNIYVGTGGGRSDITQDQSAAIWNVYKNYLPSKVNIIPSSNPISSIYSYAKDEPDAQIKWFLGSREDKPEDFADFEKRTKSALSKTNIEPINIVTSGGVSGTKARAVLDNKEEFFNYLPNIEDSDKEQIYGILRPSQIDEEIDDEDLKDIDQTADEELETDVVFNTGDDDHFIRRANERGADKEDLIDFFRELGKSKDEFKDEFEELISKRKPGEPKPAIVAKDEYTGFSIPFVSDNIRKILATTVLAPGMKPKEKKTFSFSESENFEPLQNQDLELNTSSESSRVDYYKDHITNVVPSDFKVDKHKDKIVVSNITKKGLEHNSEFKDKLISLTLFMMDSGLNLEPLPDIIFIEDDKKNADNILGRTAYYDPNTNCITLYTYSRHPKDILRSYAHEMIHHMQNLEGRIQGIEGHNINEDEYLQELELEAYSKGNMCFRSWENNLKND